jgi:antitoxin YefM
VGDAGVCGGDCVIPSLKPDESLPFAPCDNQGNLFSMTTVLHMTADELNESFLNSVKAAFKGRAIEIAVSDSEETAYLLQHPANRERLLRAVADVEAGRNIITPDQAQFQ